MTEALLSDLFNEADNLERRLMSRDLTGTRVTADDISPTLADLRNLRNEVSGWRSDEATVIRRFRERLEAIEAAQRAFSEVPRVDDGSRRNWSFPTVVPFLH